MHKPSLLDRLVKFFDRWFDNMEKRREYYAGGQQEDDDDITEAIMDINRSLGFSDEINNPCRFL